MAESSPKITPGKFRLPANLPGPLSGALACHDERASDRSRVLRLTTPSNVSRILLKPRIQISTEYQARKCPCGMLTSHQCGNVRSLLALSIFVIRTQLPHRHGSNRSPHLGHQLRPSPSTSVPFNGHEFSSQCLISKQASSVCSQSSFPFGNARLPPLAVGLIPFASRLGTR